MEFSSWVRKRKNIIFYSVIMLNLLPFSSSIAGGGRTVVPAVGSVYSENANYILHTGAIKEGIDFKVWLRTKETGDTSLILDPQSLFGKTAVTISATIGSPNTVYAFVRQRVGLREHDNFLYEIDTKTFDRHLITRSSQLGVNQILVGPMEYRYNLDALYFDVSITERLSNGGVRPSSQRARLAPVHGSFHQVSFVRQH
jgi:hypothetical protein